MSGKCSFYYLIHELRIHCIVKVNAKRREFQINKTKQQKVCKNGFKNVLQPESVYLIQYLLSLFQK
jgi:hypothetical protein